MPVIMHVDMDSFYASVEIRKQPSLGRVPMWVGGDGRGVVLSANRLAKEWGVEGGMPSSRAKRLCPNGVGIRPNFEEYLDASRTVMEIFRTVVAVVEVASIDEAYLDATGALRMWGSAEAIGQRIRRLVREQEQLPCSVGIGPNRLVAKMASRAAKPDGIFIFYPGAHGVQFLTQYAQAGLKGQIPLYQVFSIDAITLPLQKELALGTLGAQEWVNDLPNDANKKYVADFKKKHGVYPSYYGAQSYDAIMLIASAAEALKGDVSNKDKVRAEMKKANFKSVRGGFKFNTNQFPIQNFYIQEAVKDPEGMMTVKTIATAMKDAKDPFYEKCPMK